MSAGKGVLPRTGPVPSEARAVPADSRAAILRRRAAFVSTALGALAGCPPSTTTPPAPTVGVVSPSAAPLSIATNSSVDPVPKAPAMPSLDVPSDVSDAVQKHFERLARLVPPIHARLDALAVPGCAIDDASCADAWRALAKAVVEVRESVGKLAPLCEGASADAKRFYERLDAHRRFIDERFGRLEARVAAAGGAERWQEKLDEAEAAYPRVCLDYACSDW